VTHPATIGRFKVLGLLGKGAMGVVYRGVDEALDRQVALKVMAGHLDPDARMRFKREAQAAARLQHPNIVTIYELGEHQGQPFMALELLEGIDLQRAIEEGLRPDPRATLPVVLQLLAGLGHAHEHGIVHRDVKPSNLFLPKNRPAKIMDFGVARLAGGMTTAGMVIGTPNYMSPEQVRAAGGVDGRSDLFSAGLILYELVTGEKAYQANSIVSLMYKIAHEDPDLSLIPKGRDWATLRAVIVRALQHERDLRYPDAAAMAGELALALRELGGTGDWTTAVNAGLVGRSSRAPVPVTLGTLADEAPAPTVFLGTAASDEPAPTISLGTAPQPQLAATKLEHAAASARAPVVAAAAPRFPFVLAAALGGAAVVILGITVVSLRRPAPAAVTTSASGATMTQAAAPPIVASAVRPSAPPESRPPARPASPSTLAASAPPEPAPASARLDRAESLLEAGRYAAALAEARAILKREPTNSDAQQVAEEAEASLLIETCLKKARLALAKGDKETALEEIKKGLAVNSNEGRLLALWREATQ
jgi:serine/threonine-protein kinase